MNVNSSDNADISVEHVNNQQVENSTQNQSNSEALVKVINKRKHTPMTPTPLYKFFILFRAS
jgi:hypothetical protein